MPHFTLIITTILSVAFGLLGVQETTDVQEVVMPEICDNAQDDDMDGLIDLNDPDCACNGVIVDYFVPNPSFDDTLCCPEAFDIGTGEFIAETGRMDCLDMWDGYLRQGTDYFHECIDLAIPLANIRVPQPIPDGEGAIGFGFGSDPIIGDTLSEYSSVCLINTFEPGRTYELSVSVGGGDFSMPQLELGLYGTSDCSIDLGDPFDASCPLGFPGWFAIDSIMVDVVRNGWTRVTMQFTPSQRVEKIAIGSSCAFEDRIEYYFLDHIVVYDERDLNIVIDVQSGGICDGNGVLGIDPIPLSTYQWYRDGVALVGQTLPTFQLTGMMTDNGVYQVIVQNDRGCFTSEAYTVDVNPVTVNLNPVLCSGQTVQVGSNTYDTTGMYRDTLLRANGCDSIVVLDLTINEATRFNQRRVLCQGDSLAVGQSVYRSTGIFMDTLTNDQNCDSVVMTNLTVLQIPQIVIDTTICLGESYRNGSSIFTETGGYPINYTAESGCDSAVFINLTVQEPSEFAMDVYLCDVNDTITVGDQFINAPGLYRIPLISSLGCDSTVLIRAILSSSPIILDQQREVTLGDEVVIDPLIDMAAVDSVSWLANDLITDATLMRQVVNPQEDITLSIQAVDTAGCIWQEDIMLRVKNDLSVFIPNAFTPNSDSSNDFWMIQPGRNVSSVLNVFIFDRWGNLVYQRDQFLTEEISETAGWDGTFNGNQAASGVYIFRAEVEYINGVILPFQGDITLVR